MFNKRCISPSCKSWAVKKVGNKMQCYVCERTWDPDIDPKEVFNIHYRHLRQWHSSMSEDECHIMAHYDVENLQQTREQEIS
jgi:hypothetical protein